MKKILVIEDENLIRESIAELLEHEGYTTIQANNGREGIIAAKKHQPDLIVCDIKMPEMNGHQVLMTLRDDPSISAIPFIFLSAMVDKKDFRVGMELGADDYITKPFTNNDLTNAVKTRLAKNEEVQLRLNELTKNIAQSLPHELRTPLISILGYAQLLMDKHKEIYNDQVFEFAQTIHESGLRLHKLIQNFIIYSKLEMLSNNSKGKVKIDRPAFNITKELVEVTVNKIAKKYQRLEDLEISITSTPVKILPEDILIIIEELLDNAFKFSIAGSQVAIKIYPEKQNFVMAVSDNGRGMTEEQSQRIGAYIQFERSKYEQQGSGLGLIICKKLVELHNGKLTISSVYGKETVVIVTIPGQD